MPMKCTRCRKNKAINKFSFRKDTKKYRAQCKDCINLVQQVPIMNYRKRNPWSYFYNLAMQRCIFGKYYVRKNIKFMLSVEQVKELWFRDRGEKLSRPSIDRIDSDGDYTYDNCRFIELHINRLGKRYKCAAYYSFFS